MNLIESKKRFIIKNELRKWKMTWDTRKHSDNYLKPFVNEINWFKVKKCGNNLEGALFRYVDETKKAFFIKRYFKMSQGRLKKHV
jgi:hypothetical protein